jgi:hypothetical protein
MKKRRCYGASDLRNLYECVAAEKTGQEIKLENLKQQTAYSFSKTEEESLLCPPAVDFNQNPEAVDMHDSVDSLEKVLGSLSPYTMSSPGITEWIIPLALRKTALENFLDKIKRGVQWLLRQEITPSNSGHWITLHIHRNPQADTLETHLYDSKSNFLFLSSINRYFKYRALQK